MSKLETCSAFFSMNSRRGSTASPIRVVNISSAATTSSMRTCISRRGSRLMVVSHNWLAFLLLLEQPIQGDLETGHILTIVAALDEGARPHQVAQGLCEFRDPQIFRGLEKLPRNVLLGGESMLEPLQIDPVAAGGHGLHGD